MRPETRVLVLDTAAAHVAAALVLGDQVLIAVETMDTGQSARLIPLVAGLLAQGGIGWQDLTGLGVGVGPGNFTGIRIAVAAVRGLSLGLGIPAVGVNGFDALDPDEVTQVICPAPRGMVYVRGPGNGGKAADPRLVPPDAVAGPVVSIADVGPAAFVAQLARVAAARLSVPGPVGRPAPLYLRPADAAPPRTAPPVMLG